MKHNNNMLKKNFYNLDNSNLFYLLIILFCMNFFKQGSLLCLICGFIALLKLKSFKFELNGAVLFLLSLTIMFSSMVFYSINEAIKGINYLIMFFVGYNGYATANNKIIFIKKIIFSIFFGFSIYSVLLVVQNLSIDITNGNRIAIDFWTKEELSVTLVGLIASVVIGYSFYALFLQKNLLIKIFSFCMLGASLWLNIQTATRTPILLVVVVFVFVFIVKLLSEKGVGKIRVFIFTLILLMLVGILYNKDIFGIKTFILSSPIFKRFIESGVQTSRINRIKLHFEHMFDSLFGGHKISETYGQEAHNFIQQGHDLYGIFATIMLLIFAILVMNNFFQLLVLKNKNNIDYLLISLYLAIFIQMLLEPVFTGYPILIWCFLLIHGLTVGYLNNTKYRG